MDRVPQMLDIPFRRLYMYVCVKEREGGREEWVSECLCESVYVNTHKITNDSQYGIFVSYILTSFSLQYQKRD